MISDGSDAVGYYDAGQFGAVIKGFKSNAGDAAANYDVRQVDARIEGLVSDGGDAVRDRVTAGLAFRTLDQQSLACVNQDPGDTAEK